MAVAFNGKHLAKFIRPEEYEAIYPQVELAHKQLETKTGFGNDFLGWLDLPVTYDKEEFARIKEAAQKIRSDSDVLLVAVERVQEAMLLGMEKTLQMGLKNLVFLSLDAAELEEYFADSEVDRLFLNFCDPWPRKKNAKRRLTYHTFLEKYKKVLKLGGQIHFKTDNANLFAWSLPEMESCFLELRNVTDDLHANGPVGIMTGYEEKFYALGTPIHRVEAVVTTKQPRPAEEKPEPEEAED